MDELPRLRRVIISVPDLAAARVACDRLLELDEFDRRLGEMTADFQANLTQLVVSYARPFKTSWHAEEATPQLWGAQDVLEPDEWALHQRVLALRDEEFAHSDPTAATVTIYVEDGQLIPVGRVTRLGSVTRAEVEKLRRMVTRLEDELWRVRRELEARIPDGKYPSNPKRRRR